MYTGNKEKFDKYDNGLYAYAVNFSNYLHFDTHFPGLKNLLDFKKIISWISWISPGFEISLVSRHPVSGFMKPR